MLLGCDDAALMPYDEESSMIEQNISQDHEEDSSYDEHDAKMDYLRLVESDIAHIIDELCSESHRGYMRGLFSKFCEYNEAFEGCADRPARHE